MVDDDKIILKYLQQSLQKHYPDDEIRSTQNVMEALLWIKSGFFIPDILVADFNMPELNGISFAKYVKDWSEKNNTFVYIMMISGNSTKEVELKCFEAADDFVRKPIDIEILYLRINVALRTLSYIKEKNNLILKNNQIFKDLDDINVQNESALERLSLTIEQFLLSFSEIIEYKDHQNNRHTYRVGNIAYLLGKELNIQDKLDSIKYAGFLHDIGKIGIPDMILKKKTSLTFDEMQIMKKHPEIGVKILKNISYFKECFEGILHHHERWDGDGYPNKLEKEKIPVIARIVSVAEVFDVITCAKPYREPKNLEQSHEEIMNNSRSQFDPDVVNAFDRLYKQGAIQVFYNK